MESEEEHFSIIYFVHQLKMIDSPELNEYLKLSCLSVAE